MSLCVVCLENGVSLLKTVCSGSPEQSKGLKHEPVLCLACMHSLCTKAIAEFKTPKCPVCRRQIFFDSLVSLGWKEPAQMLVHRFRNSMSAIDGSFRMQEGLATHDVLTAAQVDMLSGRKRCIADLSNMLGFVLMYCALNQFAPGPVYEVDHIGDDSFWIPKSNAVFYTVVPYVDPPRTLLLLSWNGLHHGVCVRASVSSTGVRVLDSHSLPFFSPICIMRRRQKRAQLEASPCTRTRSSCIEQFNASVQTELYQSLLLIRPVS